MTMTIDHRMQLVDTRCRVFFVALMAGSAIFAIPKPASAACAPIGLIQTDWERFESQEGPCTDNEMSTSYGGKIEEFEFGWINWPGIPAPAAYAVWGNIATQWTGRYGGMTAGQPMSNQGSVTGALVAQENIFATPAGVRFDLVWSPGGEDGAACENAGHVCEIYGSIDKAWVLETGVGRDAIVTPIDDAYSWGPGQRQDFNGGYITWNSSNNAVCAFLNSGALYWEVGSGACS